MPDTTNLAFYSTKYNKYEKEICYLEIYDGERKTSYILNPITRIFEEKKKESNDTLDAPRLPEESER